MTVRELAWRVFAAELTAASVEERGAGERATTYLLSPAGARMSRVLAAGILSPARAIGADPTQPFLRATLSDPTGHVDVTAGSFQPAALAALRSHDTEGPVLLVGKAHLFRGRDGVGHPSIRAERLRPIAVDELAELQTEIANQTAERVRLVEVARGAVGPPSAAPAVAPARWVDGARRAATAYPTVDLGALRTTLQLRPSSPPSGGGASPASLPSPPPRAMGTGPGGDRAALSAAERAQESAFLDIIDELADRSPDGCADLREALQRAAARGVREAVAEELRYRLAGTGVLEEPVVGKVRRTGS